MVCRFYTRFPVHFFCNPLGRDVLFIRAVCPWSNEQAAVMQGDACFYLWNTYTEMHYTSKIHTPQFKVQRNDIKASFILSNFVLFKNCKVTNQDFFNRDAKMRSPRPAAKRCILRLKIHNPLKFRE